MLRWLWNKLFGDRYDYYHPGERKLYQYFNRKKMVTADPMILYKRVMDVGPEMDIDWRLANSLSKDAKLGHQQLVAKIRAIFNVAPLEEGGLTESECVDLLTHFMTYTGMIKKNSPTYATSATATSPSSESSSTEDPATTRSSDSGSTAPEQETRPQAQSPSEPPSPSAPSTPDSTTL